MGNGEQLREKLKEFPSPWVNFFLSSKILVIGVASDNAIAAYGIRSILNVVVLYVKEGHRGRGVGRQMWEKAYNIARKRGIHFFTAETPFHHLGSKYGLLLFSKYRCKVIKRLEKRRTVLMVFPFTIKGEIFYMLLRIICFMAPAELLGQVTDWMSKRTTRNKDVEG